MAKFHGLIGYGETSETAPGVWTEAIVERSYNGDVNRISRNWQSGENLNDDLIISNEFSIVADPFAYDHFHRMRYIKWMGTAWKITRVVVQRPRLILTIGGVYNGESGPSTESS